MYGASCFDEDTSEGVKTGGTCYAVLPGILSFRLATTSETAAIDITNCNLIRHLRLTHSLLDLLQ